MVDIRNIATFALGDRSVRRVGYGAMQLAGPHVMGPPKDRAAAVAVLREAVECGVDHIDTSDFYGPHITNQIIREALHPYREDLTIVTKVGAKRDSEGGWLPAASPQELKQAVHDNLRNLGLDVLEVVNFRVMLDMAAPSEGAIEEQVTALAELREEGLIRHIGLSNATSTQVAQARSIVPIVCVQNMYNIAMRNDDALIDELASEGIAFVPFFPLGGGLNPLQSNVISEVARRHEITPMQVASRWLLQRSPNVLLIPGTSSIDHLHENLAVAHVSLDEDDIAALNSIGD